MFDAISSSTWKNPWGTCQVPRGYIPLDAKAIFIDLDVVPKQRKDVVVRLNNIEVGFRRLVLEEDVEYLMRANPNWPGTITEISTYADSRIVGVVIGKWVEK